jgi:hypothetical protein
MADPFHPQALLAARSRAFQHGEAQGQSSMTQSSGTQPVFSQQNTQPVSSHQDTQPVSSHQDTQPVSSQQGAAILDGQDADALVLHPSWLRDLQGARRKCV